MKLHKYLLEKFVLLLGILLVILPQIIMRYISEMIDWMVSQYDRKSI
jgi:hypothetical protein